MPTSIDNPSLEISHNIIVAANCTPKINVDIQLYDSDSDTPSNDSDNSSISSLNPLLSSDVSFHLRVYHIVQMIIVWHQNYPSQMCLALIFLMLLHRVPFLVLN